LIYRNDSALNLWVNVEMVPSVWWASSPRARGRATNHAFPVLTGCPVKAQGIALGIASQRIGVF
jgi:hypothetical protein